MKIASTFALAGLLAASAASVAGATEAAMDPATVTEATATSAADAVVPMLLLLVIGAALTSSGKFK